MRSSSRLVWFNLIFKWIFDDGISTLFNYYPMDFLSLSFIHLFQGGIQPGWPWSENDIELQRLMAELFRLHVAVTCDLNF